MRRILYLITAAVFLLASCDGTWIMYDTGQKDHIFFQDRQQTLIKSFALLANNEIQVEAPVHIMGMVSDKDRQFKVESLPVAENATIVLGGTIYPVISAREGVDFELGKCVIPAGATSTKVTLTLKRQPEMKEGAYVRVLLKLVPYENFEPLPADSSSVNEVKTPYFQVYVNDGEPACPTWWRQAPKKPAGWDYDLGNFYPDKFRKLLDLYHKTAESNPTFYEYCVALYGENLDAEPNSDNHNMNRFWRQTYAAAWANYVFCPLYEYYEDYYAKHPDDPHFEVMGSDKVNINNMIGWGDPRSGRYGFLN